MKKVDELTKNRREMNRENISGHMPEDREMPEYCPVRNFETYLQKLHPQCNRLWQLSDKADLCPVTAIICAIEQFLPRIVAPVARMEWLV
jgi:hypothetical protein